MQLLCAVEICNCCRSFKIVTDYYIRICRRLHEHLGRICWFNPEKYGSSGLHQLEMTGRTCQEAFRNRKKNHSWIQWRWRCRKSLNNQPTGTLCGRWACGTWASVDWTTDCSRSWYDHEHKSEFNTVETLTLHKIQSKVKKIIILILAAVVVYYNCQYFSCLFLKPSKILDSF